MQNLVSKDGTVLAYDRQGEGPPLIVMGGALNDRQITAPVAEALARRFTVYNYDRRGRGASGITLPYRIDDEVDDLDALIAEAGGSAMLFANCTGGMLALEAVARGSAVTKLALYEPPYIVGENPLRLNEEFRTELADHLDNDRPGDAVAHFLTRTVGLPPEVLVKFQQSPMWGALIGMAPSLRYDVEIARDNSIPVQDLLDRIALPTLAVRGLASPQWQVDSVKVLADALPNARCHSLEGQNHNLDAEVVGPLLEEFFAD
ncbi:hypothetical protein BJF79_02670 [Actinomadura sp. CNU-125]|uniref:alpha/beta fold hydrolase n=1 Tax=Actinomadura sp. CNU-125 TaxID=1904961 RepID=UPI000960F625|nr:alpha/beta hydrolase [Actinomadura sp. CNU-125]OLT19131.1 hypothetical protein BJF79_02670 [Actinomadura sp. CNU-125]